MQLPAQLPPRPVGNAIGRGAAAHCPACGKGKLFDGYLRVHDVCGACGEELHHHRADDAPPYFTVLIVGHFMVGFVLSAEKLWAPPIWLQMTIWLPLTAILALAALRPIKGALVGLQWALYMHGFDLHTPPEHSEISEIQYPDPHND